MNFGGESKGVHVLFSDAGNDDELKMHVMRNVASIRDY